MGGWGSGKDLGESGGSKTIIKIYCMEKLKKERKLCIQFGFNTWNCIVSELNNTSSVGRLYGHELNID